MSPVKSKFCKAGQKNESHDSQIVLDFHPSPTNKSVIIPGWDQAIFLICTWFPDVHLPQESWNFGGPLGLSSHHAWCLYSSCNMKLMTITWLKIFWVVDCFWSSNEKVTYIWQIWFKYYFTTHFSNMTNDWRVFWTIVNWYTHTGMIFLKGIFFAFSLLYWFLRWKFI